MEIAVAHLENTHAFVRYQSAKANAWWNLNSDELYFDQNSSDATTMARMTVSAGVTTKTQARYSILLQSLTRRHEAHLPLSAKGINKLLGYVQNISISIRTQIFH